MRQGIVIGFLGTSALVAGCSGQAPQMASSTGAIYDFTSEGTCPPAPDVAAEPTTAIQTVPSGASPKAAPTQNLQELFPLHR